MTSRSTTVLVGIASIFAGLLIPVGNAQQASGPAKVVQLTGLVGVKDNAKGTLHVENGQLHLERKPGYREGSLLISARRQDKPTIFDLKSISQEISDSAMRSRNCRTLGCHATEVSGSPAERCLFTPWDLTFLATLFPRCTH